LREEGGVAVDIGISFIRNARSYNCCELRQDGDIDRFEYSYETMYTNSVTPFREFERDFSGDWKVLWKA
jgi:hypothetical protein